MNWWRLTFADDAFFFKINNSRQLIRPHRRVSRRTELQVQSYQCTPEHQPSANIATRVPFRFWVSETAHADVTETVRLTMGMGVLQKRRYSNRDKLRHVDAETCHVHWRHLANIDDTIHFTTLSTLSNWRLRSRLAAYRAGMLSDLSEIKTVFTCMQHRYVTYSRRTPSRGTIRYYENACTSHCSTDHRWNASSVSRNICDSWLIDTRFVCLSSQSTCLLVTCDQFGTLTIYARLTNAIGYGTSIRYVTGKITTVRLYRRVGQLTPM